MVVSGVGKTGWDEKRLWEAYGSGAAPFHFSASGQAPNGPFAKLRPSQGTVGNGSAEAGNGPDSVVSPGRWNGEREIGPSPATVDPDPTACLQPVRMIAEL